MTLSDLIQYARKIVITFVGSILLAYVLIILLSHSPDDPSWTHLGQVTTITNMSGSTGAWLSDFILTFLGKSIWFILLFVVYEIILLWWQRRVIHFQLRFVAYIFLIFALSGFLASLNITGNNLTDQSSGNIAIADSFVENMLEDGGIIGYEIAVGSLALVGKIATWILLGVFTIVLTVIAFSIRWKRFFATFLPFAILQETRKEPNVSSSYTRDIEDMRAAKEMRQQAFLQTHTPSQAVQNTEPQRSQSVRTPLTEQHNNRHDGYQEPIQNPLGSHTAPSEIDNNYNPLVTKARKVVMTPTETPVEPISKDVDTPTPQQAENRSYEQAERVQEPLAYQPTSQFADQRPVVDTHSYDEVNDYSASSSREQFETPDTHDEAQTTFEQPTHKPVFEQPTHEPVFEQPTHEPVFEQPTHEPVFEQPTHEPVFEQPTHEPVFEQPTHEPVAEQSGQDLFFDYFSDNEQEQAPQTDQLSTTSHDVNGLEVASTEQMAYQTETTNIDTPLQSDLQADHHQQYDENQSAEVGENVSHGGLLMDYSDIEPLEGEKKNLKNSQDVNKKAPKHTIKKIGASIKNMLKTSPESDATSAPEEQVTSQNHHNQDAQIADDQAFKGKSRAAQTVKRRKRLSKLPSLDILDKPDPNRRPSYTLAELNDLSRLLEQKLQDFNVQAQVVNSIPGPVVTRFEVELAPGIKVAKVTNISRDLARSLSMASLRVVEIIPGKPYIGIEVPNRTREMVRLIELLDTKDYRDKTAQISMAMGKDIGGKAIITDLAKAPHMLVAGTTGSGKSVLVNCMLLSMLLKYTPDDLKLILIDPKQLELANYNDIPHLLTPVVTDMTEAAGALSWCVAEMEKRYQLMSLLRVRKLNEFNKKVIEAEKAGNPIIDPLWRPNDSVSVDKAPKLKPLPMIVIVADEFADMIMQVGKQAEELITRLAQKSRASGIHLMLATQRPSVDVITGLIKANVPVRAGLRVNSKIDSRTILDASGAEDMLGNGDMLFLGPGQIESERVHGAFVSDEEVNRVCEAWRERGSPNYIESFAESFQLEDPISGGTTGGTSGADDVFYNEAVAFILESRKVSASSIQRKFSIGYNRAARIVDSMEDAGIVSKMIKGKREILV